MKIFDDLHAFIWRDPTVNNCNTYLIHGDKTILVDPGHNHLFEPVRENLTRLSLTLEDIDVVLVTHGHPDHIEAVQRFVDSPALISISAAEMDFFRQVTSSYGEILGLSNLEPDILLQEGDFNVGTLHFEMFHTPGHSPGSFCLYWPDKKALFTGDVVFSQGIGRTDLPGGNAQQIKESIRRLSSLPVDILLPGHGDILSGRDPVENNFKNIEAVWFAYL